MKKFKAIFLCISLLLIQPVIAINNEIIISDKPTSEELTEIFYKTTAGELDPYEVLSKIIEKGDNAVKGLEEFLYAEPDLKEPIESVNWESPTGAQSDILYHLDRVNPDKVYTVLALDAIATKEATLVLLNAAIIHPSAQVRAEIVKAFAFSNYYRTAENSEIKPDKEILLTLIENADDTSYVENIGMSIGEIAREGIKNWLDEDYGALRVGEQEVLTSNSDHISIKEHRKQWWVKNKINLKWNPDSKHFELKN